MSKPIAKVARMVQKTNDNIKRSFSMSSSAQYSGANNNGTLNKQWVHPPDALQFGRVEYTVRLLGNVDVASNKGTDVVKDAIQKIRFQLHLSKSTNGTAATKLRKVEIHINVDGVTITEAKSKITLHKFPLHRISFCADDKQDKRVFSFIAKKSGGVDTNEEYNHVCFVFLSDKLAEEITLTIGEAFDLAYRKFIDNNGKDLETKKQVILLRKRVTELEQENETLKAQLASQNRSQAPPSLGAPLPPKGAPPSAFPPKANNWETFGTSSPEPPQAPTSPVPHGPPIGIVVPHPPAPRRLSNPRSMNINNISSDNATIMAQLSANAPEVGRKLENLQLDSMDDIFDDEFDPRAGEKPKVKVQSNVFHTNGINANANKNGCEEPSAEDLESAINMLDARLADMREGFNTGMSFGTSGDLGGADLLGEFDPIQPSSKS